MYVLTMIFKYLWNIIYTQYMILLSGALFMIWIRHNVEQSSSCLAESFE